MYIEASSIVLLELSGVHINSRPQMFSSNFIARYSVSWQVLLDIIFIRFFPLQFPFTVPSKYEGTVAVLNEDRLAMRYDIKKYRRIRRR